MQRFKTCAAADHGTDLYGITSEQMVQHVADNADHNLCTLDGNNTFHGMAIIASITPSTGAMSKAIARKKVSIDELRKIGRIPVYHHKTNDLVLSRIKYHSLNIVPVRTICNIGY